MNILIIGNGNHTNRRIIPSLNKIKDITSITVLDRNSKNQYLSPLKKINIANSETILKNRKKYDSVIIASYPSAHIENFNDFKEKGDNFIFEKPISNDLKFMTSSKFKKIYEEKKIIETLTFFHHPFWKYMNDLIQQHSFDVIESKFTIPNNFDLTDFRLNKHLGGSTILDNGIYPISCLVELLKINIDNLVTKEINYDKKLNIDTSGKATFTNENISKINIQWGFSHEYKNYIKLKNESLEIEIPFIYSKPEKFIPKVYVNKNDEKVFRNIDQFKKFYSSFFNKNEKDFFYCDYESIYNRYHLMEQLIND
ncbi:Gfo/Idh/MocA family oxidoreductase [Acidimicrobiia bacterium]|nr:Gfo/Idh/MocA family oxidoreductase [Acidimicrobiia bacterium]